MRFFWPFDMDEARKFYADNGYAIFSCVMLPALCDWVNGRFRSVADADFAPILNHDRKDPLIQDAVMRHGPVVEIVEYLTDSECCGCQTYFLFKEPGTRFAGQAFNPHQDNSYPRSEPGAYLAVDISLCDQDAESGGICLWPGTHKLGLLPFEEMTGYREKEGERPGNKVVMPDGVILSDVEQTIEGSGPLNVEINYSGIIDAKTTGTVYYKRDMTLNKGDALVFDGNTIHASYPNRSNRGRPAIITNYLRKGAEMVEGRTAKRMRIPLR